MDADILWAKLGTEHSTKWLSLPVHLMDTAEVSKYIWRDWVSDSVKQMVASDLYQMQESTLVAGNNYSEQLDLAERLLYFLAMVHDIGKATYQFQQKARNINTDVWERLIQAGFVSKEESVICVNRMRHEVATLGILECYGVNKSVSAVAGAHHGRPLSLAEYHDNSCAANPNCYFGSRDANVRSKWERIWEDLLGEISVLTGFRIPLLSYSESLQKSGQCEKRCDFPVLGVTAQMLMSAVLVVSDWVASNSDYFGYQSLFFEEQEPCEHEETHRSIVQDPKYEHPKYEYPKYEHPDYAEAVNSTHMSSSLISIRERARVRAKLAWDRMKFTVPWEHDYGIDFNALYDLRFSTADRRFEPRSFQRNVLSVAQQLEVPGIMMVEAPMGLGKTEAALVAAEIMASKAGSSGVYFGMPTQATSDSIFPRLLQWVNALDRHRTDGENVKHSINLVHGNAQFNHDFRRLKLQSKRASQSEILSAIGIYDEAEEGSASVHSWFSGKKRAILADFVVGTIDQLLTCSLKSKHVYLRHLGIAGKVVVCDEIHSYDAYMSVYLERTLEWLGFYGVPVILLSATLHSGTKTRLVKAYLRYAKFGMESEERPAITNEVADKDVPDETVQTSQSRYNRCKDFPYPLITYTEGSKIYQFPCRVDGTAYLVEIRSLPREGMMDLVLQYYGSEACVGIVVNTVKRAQELSAQLKQVLGAEHVLTLHSSYVVTDRMRRERELLDKLGKPGHATRPAGFVVVGTQVMEQSLDIDFDVLITDLCPMDLLLQRMGRLHRHKRDRPKIADAPLCYVLDLDESTYDDGSVAVYGKYLLMRTKDALSNRCVTLPDQIPKLVESVYSVPECLMQSSLEDERKDELFQAYQDYAKHLKSKEERAHSYLLNSPWHLTKNGKFKEKRMYQEFANLLVHSELEKVAEKGVRDIGETIEVIAIKKMGTSFRYVSAELSKEFEEIEFLDVAHQILLAKERIRLPRIFSSSYNIDRSVVELERMTIQEPELKRMVADSDWLKGELFLVLDESNRTVLCDYELTYDYELGLQYRKKEG